MSEMRSTGTGGGHRPKPDRVPNGPPQPRSAVVAFALLLGGAAAAIFLVGRAEQGNVGVFLLCAGAAMIACPPLVKVKPGVAAAAVAFLVCSGLSLLPARLFHVPIWRQALAAAPDLPLPATVSAAPAQTVFWLAVLAVTLLTALFMQTQPLRSKTLSAFALSGAGICGLYSALSMLARIPGWIYPFSNGTTFGFFPNRNHAATLLVTGSMLSIGILGVAFRQRQRWASNIAVATLALCVSGLLFFSESRGGVVFLLVGAAGWLAGLGMYRDRRVLVAVVLALVVGGGAFLTVKSTARDRLLDSVFAQDGEPPKAVPELPAGERRGGEITVDDRVRIYRDTLAMIRDVPLTGTGLGTFALVFAPYRQASANYNTVLHPESDWLMVAAETGLPALLCLVGFIAMTFRGWRPSRVHRYWPLRWGIMMAAAAAALHGLVDVPVHRVALGWWALVVAGLSLQPGLAAGNEHGTSRGGRVARAVFAMGGILSVLTGAMLVRAEWFGGAALPPYAAEVAQKEVAATFKRGDLAGATEQARRAIGASPLASPLYYQLGLLLIREEDTDAEIDRAFGTQRVLSPWTPLTPRLQAVVWMPLDPARSAPLFIEALRRQETLRRISPSARPPEEYWSGLVQQTGSFPLVQDRLWDACAGRGAALTLAWLENADARNVKARLPQVAGDETLLAQLSAAEKQRLVSVWRGKGDPASLQTFLDSRGPGWPR